MALFLIGALCGVVLTVVVAALWPLPRARLELVAWWEESDDFVLEMRDGRRFRGDCTVWHSYDTGVRQDTETEERLAQLWNLVTWGRVDALRREKP